MTSQEPSTPQHGPAGEASDVRTIAQRVAALDSLDTTPLQEHAAAYADLHASLQAALNEIDRD